MIGAAAYGQMAYLLFASNYEALKTEDGSFSEEKIQELLELSKQLVDNNPSEDMEHTWSENFRGLMLSLIHIWSYICLPTGLEIGS